MFVSDILNQVRKDLSELNPQGRFSTEYLLEKFNEVSADVVIPDLYSIDNYNFLYNLIITGSISLSVSDKNAKWVEGDLSTWVDGSEDPYVFYTPTLFAMVQGGEYRIPVSFIPFSYGYFMNYNQSLHKPKALGTRMGQKILMYDNKYDTLYLEAIQIKTYGYNDIVDLENHIARKTLIPAIVSAAFEKDKGFNEANISDRRYARNLQRLERDVIKSRESTEIIPRASRRGSRGLREV